MAEFAELRLGDKTLKLPIIVGTENEKAIDISKLRAETGFITYDPGYANTGAAQSSITFIDGENGVLRYRGIPIEELAEKSDFLEVAYLLIYGHLPSEDEYHYFAESIRNHTMLHEDFKRFFGAMPKDAHPMAACSAAVGALSTFYPDSLEPTDPRQTEIAVQGGVLLLLGTCCIHAPQYFHDTKNRTIFTNIRPLLLQDFPIPLKRVTNVSIPS
jgi:citrate synthase